jgi:hypothetical protein
MSAAADRLAHTRLAIVAHLADSPRGRPREAPDPAAQEAATHGRWAGLRAAGRDYWEHHPVRMGLQLAEPTVRAYAHRHPARLLAACAALGALLVLARPWRLVSVTGLMLAAVRSPRLSSLVLSAFMAGGERGNESPRETPRRST